MKSLIAALLLLAPLAASAQSADDELVNVRELIPDIVIDLKYNTTDNFLHQKLYSTDECLLSHIAVRQLALVQDSLRKIGLGIKIWDGYRPRAVQFLMWEIFPDPTYVADPVTGSKHNRGAAVDLTLVNSATGQELNMPTGFDYFGDRAHQHYPGPGLTQEQIDNREFLYNMMTSVGGFSPYDAEWWHYEVPAALNYPLLDFQLK